MAEYMFQNVAYRATLYRFGLQSYVLIGQLLRRPIVESRNILTNALSFWLTSVQEYIFEQKISSRPIFEAALGYNVTLLSTYLVVWLPTVPQLDFQKMYFRLFPSKCKKVFIFLCKCGSVDEQLYEKTSFYSKFECSFSVSLYLLFKEFFFSVFQ